MGTCGTCRFWNPTTYFENVPNSGDCQAISEKVTADVKYGWEGGYVRGYETEEDFGCTLYQAKELEDKNHV